MNSINHQQPKMNATTNNHSLAPTSVVNADYYISQGWAVPREWKCDIMCPVVFLKLVLDRKDPVPEMLATYTYAELFEICNSFYSHVNFDNCDEIKDDLQTLTSKQLVTIICDKIMDYLIIKYAS